MYISDCVHPTEPGLTQVEGGGSVEAEGEGKESNSEDEEERCQGGRRQIHKTDVDPRGVLK